MDDPRAARAIPQRSDLDQNDRIGVIATPKRRYLFPYTHETSWTRTAWVPDIEVYVGTTIDACEWPDIQEYELYESEPGSCAEDEQYSVMNAFRAAGVDLAGSDDLICSTAP